MGYLLEAIWYAFEVLFIGIFKVFTSKPVPIFFLLFVILVIIFKIIKKCSK